jgi:signal transduction histidine kinase
MLEQLIDNALRHNPSSQPTVTLTSTKKGKHWHLRVEDNGPGIDADYRRLVMGLFRTVGNPHLPEGHGAGLAFCARIARHHGGQLRINSSRLGGTSMQFTLMEARHDD